MPAFFVPPVLTLVTYPRDSIRFRILRDGLVTPGVKRLRVCRALDAAGQGEIAQEALAGEFTPFVSILRQELVDQPVWVVFAEDATPPARVHAQYIAIPGAGTYTIDIGESFPRHLLQGDGYLSGSFPDGITTLNGVPVAATVRAHYRPAGGEPGDGLLVASTESAADGTWIISGLNPDLKFDIIGRLDGQNDVIAANVQPMPLGG